MRTLSFASTSAFAFAVAAATFLAASPALAQFDEAPPEFGVAPPVTPAAFETASW